MKYSSIRDKLRRRVGEANLDPVYQEVLWIKDKFLEYGLISADPFSWKLIDDYLCFRQYNLVTKSQHGKIAELIFKYGKESLIWGYLDATKPQRSRELMRVIATGLHAQAMIEKARGKPGLHIPFLKCLVDFRRTLLTRPLSEKQWNFLHRVERALGIYYEDLTPEENGIITEGVDHASN